MAKKEIPSRASFMREGHKQAFAAAGNPPRSHHNCIKLTGVARPGKTAKDRWANSVK